MAPDLSQLLPPPSPPFPVHWSGLASSPTSSDRSDDDDDHYLAHLTRQMANHMIRQQSHVGRQKPVSLPAAAIAGRDMPRWADLFTDSPQSRTVENPNKITPGLRWNQTIPSDGKWTREEKPSDVRPEKQRKPRAKNNQWKTRKGECYVGLSLPHQQGKAGEGGPEMRRGVFPGDDQKTRSVGGGTGVFLPKTGGKTEQGRKQPRGGGGGGGGGSTVLIPARVAQALLLHFSKMGLPQPHPSPVLVGVPDYSSGGGGWDQQKSQTQASPGEEQPPIDCNEMGLPQEWMY